MAMAKPSDSAADIFAVVMPTTAPDLFTSGPPLLPGLMAASVCTRVSPPEARTAETMPRVTVPCSMPSAEPTASTSSPTWTVRAGASRSVGCEAGGCSTCTSARSTSLAVDET